MKIIRSFDKSTPDFLTINRMSVDLTKTLNDYKA